MSNIPNSAMHHARAEPTSGTGPGDDAGPQAEGSDAGGERAGQRGKEDQKLPLWPFAALAIGLAVGIGAAIARTSLKSKPRSRKKPSRSRKAK